uniref:hypothetical protein n=1 Tax=Pararhizobium sp. IMCC3301 TaxID=3067904 RepID=UPI002741AEC9|nr:hypothetical protein [Pararhizobium sp. IMCC3301]
MPADLPVARRFASTEDGRPSADMLSFYQENGFLILQNFANDAACDDLTMAQLEAGAPQGPREAYALYVVDRTASRADDNWLKRAANMPARGFA